MSADLRDPVISPDGGPPATDRPTHRRRAWFLAAVGVWNVWLWVTRTVNLFGEERSAGFVAVHLVLYGVSTVIAVALVALGWRMHREARGAASS